MDASLLVPYGARLFIGHLAEVSGVVLVGTDTIGSEVHAAMRKKLLKRHLMSPMLGFAQQVEADRAEFDRWRKACEAAGLWTEVGVADWSPHLVAAGIHELVGELWNMYPTDPEDEHLAEAAVMCETDALLSANMHMVEDGDWLRFGQDIGVSALPALRRQDSVIDWMLQAKDAAKDAERLLGIVVGAMRPTGDLKTPLTKWARSLVGSFPDMSGAMLNHLDAISESALQAIFERESKRPLHATTRQYVAESRPLPS